MIYIVNRSNFKRDSGDDVVYVGRPSLLGNPFKIDAFKGMTREKVIRIYKGYFYRMLLTDDGFRREVLTILHKARAHHVYLVCWCAPLPCHADVIKEYVDTILEGERDGHF
jgi:hypothetical protein